MAKTIIVKNAIRKTKRDIEKVLGNDLRKFITELVTNSDDSYKRLNHTANNSEQEIQPIYIEINKTKKEIFVIDNAEGMDESGIEKNFKIYGDDKSGASNGYKEVRGLFGQGASDVLFNAALHNKKSEIKTLKDGKCNICRFSFKNNQKTISLIQDNTHLRDIRTKFNIPNNGTLVYFELPEKVIIPNDLLNKIKNFYMLRYILNDNNRKVVLRTKTKNKVLEEKLTYEFPPEDKLLTDQSINFKYENEIVSGRLKLFLIDKKDEEKYGELKILVFDNEKAVYDNTFFNFGDKYPGIEKLFGYLELTNSSEIIRKKLNQETPEEILTDSRDGFNKNHEFYKTLCIEIEPYIKKVLDKIEISKKENLKSLDNDKNWSQALKEINKYFKEILGEEEIVGTEKGNNPPSNGLEFLFPRIKITNGKKYSIKLLINTSLICADNKITIDSSNNQKIDINPKEIIISSEDIKSENLDIKNISITGKEITLEDIQVTAKSDNGYVGKLFVSVIEKDIHYPNYGLEFWPNIITTKPEITSKIHLYFDTNKFPIGSEVNFESLNEEILIDKKSHILSKDNMITDDIGVVENNILGSKDQTEGIIQATCKNYPTSVQVYIKNDNPDSKGVGGFFSGIDLDDLPGDIFYQTYYYPKNGRIKIMLNNCINKQQLGEINEKKREINQKKYLADLCSVECAKQLIIKKIEKGHFGGNDFEETYDELQREKNKLFNILSRNLNLF